MKKKISTIGTILMAVLLVVTLVGCGTKSAGDKRQGGPPGAGSEVEGSGDHSDRPDIKPGEKPEGTPPPRPDGSSGKPDIDPDNLPEDMPDFDPDNMPEGIPDGAPPQRDSES